MDKKGCKWCTVDGAGYAEDLIAKDFRLESGETIMSYNIGLDNLGGDKPSLACYFYFGGNDAEPHIRAVPVNYCPICGRRLTKDN